MSRLNWTEAAMLSLLTAGLLVGSPSNATLQAGPARSKTSQWRNLGQRWLTEFDGRGFVVSPENGKWQWGLELESYGCAGELRATAAHARMSASVGQMTYQWDTTVREWWLDGAGGLEHGFTLTRLPCVNRGRLLLRMKIRGGLAVRMQAGGVGASFVDAAGRPVISYSGLAVRDADGKALPAKMEAQGEQLGFVVEANEAHYPITIDPWIQQTTLLPFDGAYNDLFGHSVAVDGDTAVVGAYGKNSRTGAVYVYVRDGTSWSLQAELTAGDAAAEDYFGVSVAISGDTLIAGAIGKNLVNGAVYVFVRAGSSWSQLQKLAAPDPQGGNTRFGYSVALRGDTAVVGAPGKVLGYFPNYVLDAGAAYVFTRSGTLWSQQQRLTASDYAAADLFGSSVALNGSTALVGAFGKNSSAGAAYVFVSNGSSWTQQAKLTVSDGATGDRFAGAVAISGDTALVGAWGKAANTGSAYMFTRSGSGWSQQQKLSGEGYAGYAGRFGYSVALTGDTAIVGGRDQYWHHTGFVFRRTGTAWAPVEQLPSGSPVPEEFGVSVSLGGNTGVVGVEHFNAGHFTTGAAFVFVLSADTTPPLIVPTVSGTQGSNHWYTSDVQVTWSVSDPESGIAATNGCGAVNLLVETQGTVVTCWGKNGAGLTSSVSVSIRIDKTVPTTSGMPVTDCPLWPPNGKMIQVAVLTASAGFSGLTTFDVTVQSNEPVGPGDIVITGSGVGPRTVQLRAEREGNGSGRIYMIRATATNGAGLMTDVTATCMVPHDQKN